VGKFPTHGHSNQHRHARFLGDQGPDARGTLARIGLGGGGVHLGSVGLAEPAALVKRVREHPLELGGERCEAALGAGKAPGIGQRADGRLHLLVREHARDTTSVSAIRLTSLSHGAGCACKLPAAELQSLLGDLPRPTNGAVLVGTETADDAAVYRLSDGLAIVSTADFFTPIVDDPYDFGRVAAANALSDVYAMGGTPLLALNLVAWSLEELGGEVLRDVLRGGAEVAAAAGVSVVGGHSIDDREPKYGLAVTGTVHPGRIVRNSTARPGDELYLTKPVGGGVASTAIKRGSASEELAHAAVEVMVTLNREAAAAALAAGASAMTDVTGFGLLGHLRELAAASGVAAEVDARAVPAIPGVIELLGSEEPPVASGSRRNRAWVDEVVRWAEGVPEERRWLLCDAMTSGGLLVAATPGSGAPGTRIGRLREGEPGRIDVL
jgi:selenide, water dikinase